MNNRFGLRDLVLVVLLVAVLVSVWLGTIENDRRWEKLDGIETLLAEQQQAIARVRAQLLQGVAVAGRAGGGGVGSEGRVNPFGRELAARGMSGFSEGGVFLDRFRARVEKLTPLVTSDAYQSTIAQYVQESLIVRDPETLEWRPWIATSWEASEDGLTYRYELRQDVVFSDGQPLTAEDVVFTYDLIMDPEINTPHLKSYYDIVESVEAEGPYTVVFRMKEPYFLGLSFTGGMSVLPKHYYEQFSPEQINTASGLLMGSGPYMLPGDPEDWRPTDTLELVRNPNYWGEAFGYRPPLDRLQWRTIKENVGAIQTFKNGDLDRLGLNPDEVPTLGQDPDMLRHGELYSMRSATGGYRYIGWNQERDGQPTKYADPRVRRAMTLLIDRWRIAEEILAGQAFVTSGPFNPLTKQANPEIEAWPYDPEQAARLLQEAGWEDRDGDGVIENAAGEPFEVTLTYPASGGESYRLVVFFIKDAMARAGVRVVPDRTEWETMLSKLKSRDFDAITLAWGGTVESDPNQIFHSAQIKGGHNTTSYRNAELDALIEQARTTIDEDKRTAMWHEVHRILHEDQPYTFLFNFRSNVLINRRVGNVRVVKGGINGLTEQFIPLEQQRLTR